MPLWETRAAASQLQLLTELVRPLPLSIHSSKQLKTDMQLREQQLQCQLEGWGLIPTSISMPELMLSTATAYGAHRLTETQPLKIQKVKFNLHKPYWSSWLLWKLYLQVTTFTCLQKKSELLILTSLKQLASPHIHHLPGRLMKPKPMAMKYRMSDQRLLPCCVSVSRMKPLCVHS